MKKAFTLIELLVVIAIIAILAAILFPVFAQAKAAAKTTSALSNVKQQALGAIMYGGDADDLLPDVPVYDSESETYIFAAKVNPYIKSAALWKDASSPYRMGSVMHALVDYPKSIGSYIRIKAPDDPCVGLPTSTRTADQYYDDIYPPTDFWLNTNMWGYKSGGCPTGGGTGGYSHPGPNLTSGPVGGDGLNGIGPPGNSMNFTSVAKAIMLISGPTDNTAVTGTTAAERSWWGANYKGLHNEGSVASFFDGHAKLVKYGATHPNNLTDKEDHWKCANCDSTPYVSPASDAGAMWLFWGTNFANATNQ